MSDLLLAIRGILSVGWDFLTGVMVPGLGISFASLFIGIFLAVLGLRVLGWALGIAGASGNADVNASADISFVENLPRLPGRK